MIKLEYDGKKTVVHFDERPDREVYDRLKEMGFRFKSGSFEVAKHVPESELRWLHPDQVHVDGEAAEAAKVSAEIEQFLEDQEKGRPPALEVAALYDKKWWLHIETGGPKRVRQAIREENDPAMLCFIRGRLARRRGSMAGFGVDLVEKKLAKLTAS